MRGFNGLVVVAISAMACIDSDIGVLDIDMTEYYDDIKAHCTGVFEGPISGDDCANCVQCSVRGQNYRLVIEAAPETYCGGSEDRQDVDCTHAQSATKKLYGTLTIGNDLVYAVAGSATVWKEHFQDRPVLECSILPDTDEFPHQRFHVGSGDAVVLPNDSGPEYFYWGRRLSEDNEVDVKWENCRLDVANQQ